MQVRRALNLDASDVLEIMAPYANAGKAPHAWRKDWAAGWPALLTHPSAVVVVACQDEESPPMAVGMAVMTPSLTGERRADARVYPVTGVPTYRKGVIRSLRAFARIMGARALQVDGETLTITEGHTLVGQDQRGRP